MDEEIAKPELGLHEGQYNWPNLVTDVYNASPMLYANGLNPQRVFENCVNSTMQPLIQETAERTAEFPGLGGATVDEFAEVLRKEILEIEPMRVPETPAGRNALNYFGNATTTPEESYERISAICFHGM